MIERLFDLPIQKVRLTFEAVSEAAHTQFGKYQGNLSGEVLQSREICAELIPFVQIEMSRALYLTKPYFDETTLTVNEKRLIDLREKVWKVLSRTTANL